MTQEQFYRGARLLAHPKRLQMLLHIGKSFRLIGATITDPRIALWRKVLFFGSIVALLVVLFFPDILGEFVLSTVLPLVGTVLGVPLDAGFDWVTFILVVSSLLRLFPPDLIAEHYQHIFG
jgi:hypothetical protein